MHQGASEQTECRKFVDWTREVLYVEASKVHFEEDRPRLGNSGKARSHEI